MLGMFQVGEIPQGLPNFSIPKSFECAMSLIPTAILITGVAILVRILWVILCIISHFIDLSCS